MRIEKYAKKKNEDGTDYIDPITNDFVNELVEVVVIDVPIEQALEEKIKEIDENSEKLIFDGFKYGGLKFSMSANAQINWTNLPNETPEDLPYYVMSKDDKPFLLTVDNIMDFYRASKTHKKSVLLEGGNLKVQLQQLKDVEQILNFKDDRISS